MSAVAAIKQLAYSEYGGTHGEIVHQPEKMLMLLQIVSMLPDAFTQYVLSHTGLSLGISSSGMP